MTKKVKQPTLEESLETINQLINEMEHQELSLDQSIQKFEQGITLVKHCQGILQNAEQKIQILLQNSSKEELKSFETITE